MAKSRNIIAIGGGGFGANPGQGIIEEYILKQTKKKNPKICFIPTATGDNEAYKVNYYATFSKLSCEPTHLDFFKRTPDLKKLIFSQDAIFVGGGNTKSMLAVWNEWGLDKILKKAYKTIYRKGFNLKDAIEKVESMESNDLQEVQNFLDTIKSSERGILR